jgi:putative acetyltransferase
METITVDRVSAPTAELRDLIAELDQTLALEYLPDQQHGLTFDALFESHVRVFIARLNGCAMGCGGVALFAGFAEVKRMYVREAARGRGLARAVLARIEAETRTSGRDLLRLETGERQLAALRLYERAGFRRCEAFGVYAALRPQAIATSIFLEKRLAIIGDGR